MYKIIKSISFNETLVILIPAFLIAGSFLIDLVGTYLGLYFLLFCLKKKEFREYKNFYFFYFLLIYLYLNFNSFLSFDPTISFKSSLSYIRIILFIFALSFFLQNNTNLYKLFYLVAILCISILFVDGITQYLLGYNLFLNPGNPSRISSLFGDKLIMGSYVARILPVIIGLSFVINFKNRQNINLITLIIGGSLIIISGERTAFVYYLILITFYFFLFKKKFFQFILIFCTLLSTIFFINNNFANRLLKETQLQIKQTSSFYSYRHELHFLTALNLFYEKKIYGQGLKSFRNLCSQDKYSKSIKEKIANDFYEKKKDYIVEYADGCNTHPHNIYLEFLAELGLIGFFFFSFIFFYVVSKLFFFLRLYFLNKKIENKSYAAAFMLLAIFSSMFPFITSGSYFNNWMLFISYIPIAFYFSLHKIYNE